MDIFAKTEVNLDKTAVRLVAKYRAYMEAVRPIDIKTTHATLSGFCEALCAVGFGRTHVEVLMAAKDAWDAQWAECGPRPAHSAMSNDPQKDWDRQIARRVRGALDGML
jgi:hypothetical protein